jgi:hypothetical protein
MSRAVQALSLLLASAVAFAGGFPGSDETLSYTVNWPTGLSLGEGRMTATHSAATKDAPDRWQFQLALDAAVPGFTVADRYHSSASGNLCSSSIEKETSHGLRKSREKTVVDTAKRVAERSTPGGGTSEISISDCARDALTFVYYLRRELSQGRIPPAESVLFGASYQVRLEYTGPQMVTVNGKKAEGDRVIAHLKGPASDQTIELFFARDPARTPLVIRAPFSLGTFSMELVR